MCRALHPRNPKFACCDELSTSANGLQPTSFNFTAAATPKPTFTQPSAGRTAMGALHSYAAQRGWPTPVYSHSRPTPSTWQFQVLVNDQAFSSQGSFTVPYAAKESAAQKAMTTFHKPTASISARGITNITKGSEPPGSSSLAHGPSVQAPKTPILETQTISGIPPAGNMITELNNYTQRLNRPNPKYD